MPGTGGLPGDLAPHGGAGPRGSDVTPPPNPQGPPSPSRGPGPAEPPPVLVLPPPNPAGPPTIEQPREPILPPPLPPSPEPYLPAKDGHRGGDAPPPGEPGGLPPNRSIAPPTTLTADKRTNPVPEPTALGLLVAGGAGLMWMRRPTRREKSRR
jgi:hypothetical protein